MAGGLDVAVLPLDLALGAEHERGPDDPLVLLAVVLLGAPGAQLFGQLVVLVGEERERQPFLLPEPGVALGWIGADAHDLVTGLEQIAIGVAAVAGLGSATRSHGLGIADDDQALAAVVVGGDGASRIVREGEGEAHPRGGSAVAAAAGCLAAPCGRAAQKGGGGGDESGS